MSVSNETGPNSMWRLENAHSPSTLHPHVNWQRDSHVYQHGEYFDSYLATEPGREEFWSSTGEGLISYAQRGSYVVVGGGLIAADEHKPQLLKEFLEFLRRRKLRGAFHNIGDHDLPLFREYGLQITKWGEEPIVDLGDVTWSGKAYEWVRRQTNFCLRHGLRAFEIQHTRMNADQWNQTLSELLEVSADCLAQKPQKEMRFFEGRIGEHELGFRRLFVVRSDEGLGRMEGFMVCTPMRCGMMWATEMYRRRTDSVRGTMAFLFHHVLEQMQQEGIKCVGLCLDPGLRCDKQLPGDSRMLRLLLTWGQKALSFVFDVPGLRHFKGRFRPRYENRYVCVTPKVTIGALVAFAQVSGLFSVNLWKVGRISVDRLRKRALRRTLAEVT